MNTESSTPEPEMPVNGHDGVGGLAFVLARRTASGIGITVSAEHNGDAEVLLTDFAVGQLIDQLRDLLETRPQASE